jgi:hypothetical protein
VLRNTCNAIISLLVPLRVFAALLGSETALKLLQVTDLAVSSSKWTPKAGEGLLIGQFRLTDGRTALLLHNHNVDSTIWPTIGFAAPHEWTVGGDSVLEVDAETGGEAPILDDSPLLPGLQMSFESGMARFLVLASKSAE